MQQITAGKTSGILSMCKLQRCMVTVGKDISLDHDLITCGKDTLGLWGHTLSLRTHTDSRDTLGLWGHTRSLRTHSVSEDTHWLSGHTRSLRTHTDSQDTLGLWGHTRSLRTHSVSEDTHWLSGHTLTLRTHSDSEDRGVESLWWVFKSQREGGGLSQGKSGNYLSPNKYLFHRMKLLKGVKY